MTPPWHRSLPLLDDAAALPARVDVAVVGAGFAGLYAAAALAEGGARVAVIDAAPRAGSSASGRAPGVVVPGLVEHPWRLAASLGDGPTRALLGLGAASARLLAEHGAQRGVTWACLDDREPAELERSAAVLARLGVPVHPLTAADARARLGTDAVGPALHLPSGATFDPAPVLCSLVDAVARAGAMLIGCAEARALDEVDGDLVLGGPGFSLTADAVVLAAGPRCAELAPTLADVVIPVREAGVWWPAPSPEGVRAQLGYAHWAPCGGGTALTGCRWATPHLEVGERGSTPSEKVLARLDQLGARLWPDRGAPAHRWGWSAATTCDGLPVVGPLPGSRRVVVVAGFGGADAALAPVCGRAAGLALLGAPAEHDLDSLTPSRM
jgi:glycine/D-amino acid oxidase-like deaminating enzyme